HCNARPNFSRPPRKAEGTRGPAAGPRARPANPCFPLGWSKAQTRPAPPSYLPGAPRGAPTPCSSRPRSQPDAGSSASGNQDPPAGARAPPRPFLCGPASCAVSRGLLVLAPCRLGSRRVGQVLPPVSSSRLLPSRGGHSAGARRGRGLRLQTRWD
ncbi:hypothetical protein P7K49_006730, partial [Saguinus oedipus]